MASALHTEASHSANDTHAGRGEGNNIAHARERRGKVFGACPQTGRGYEYTKCFRHSRPLDPYGLGHTPEKLENGSTNSASEAVRRLTQKSLVGNKEKQSMGHPSVRVVDLGVVINSLPNLG